MLYKNKRNIKYIASITIIVSLFIIISKFNLTVNFFNEEKHETVRIETINQVQEVFKKEDVIALIQKHLNKKKN